MRHEPVAGWDRVTVRYPHAGAAALGPVTSALQDGERLLLLGPSGCGKSTLIQTLTGAIPQTLPAEVTGRVHIFGEAPETRRPAAWATVVGQLFQNAEQTLCGFRVEDELAFAAENFALPPATIAGRVSAAMRRVGLPAEWRARRVATLSGGEKQLVALAAILVQQPALMIADEPTASLAPKAAAAMRRLLLQPRRGGGAIIVDHHLGTALQDVDRVAALDASGRVVAYGSPDDIFNTRGAELAGARIWTPLATRLQRALAERGIITAPRLRVAQLAADLDRLAGYARRNAREVMAASLLAEPTGHGDGPPLIRLRDAACAPLGGPVVLRGVDLSLRTGEVLGIVGANGAGKSTLAACLAGLVPLRHGRRDGPVGAVAFQNPEVHFTEGSARDELARATGTAEEAEATLARWGLGDTASQHPFTLSQGQKRRLALADLAARDRWPALVLDEPTAGLDPANATIVARHIARLAAGGRALAVITHDMDFVLRSCHRLAVLGQGGLLAEGAPARLLQDATLMRRAGLAPPEAAPLLYLLEEEAGC